ncbi:MAG: baseplate J/gp47 family protein [Paraclostridium sp.]
MEEVLQFKNLELPDFINESADSIHARMLQQAPAGVSAVEGDFFWDATRPTAEEQERLVGLKMANILKLVFPQTSYEQYLEYLGECRGVFKNPATNATGVLKITGEASTYIKKNSIFSSIATDDVEAIEYITLEECYIGDNGEVTVNVECNQAGTVGNAPKNTITVLVTNISGIASVTNESDFRNGTDIEDEENFRERLMNSYENEASSGNLAHYIQWAKEVEGVGRVYPTAEWNGAGTVKVSILDKNGDVANKELIDKVQNYIAPGGKNRGGKAPVGAIVTVTTPDILDIVIKANFTFDDGFDRNIILHTIKERVNQHLSTIDTDGIILYSAISSIVGFMVLNNEGLKDFSNLTLNDRSSNIQLIERIAVVKEVISND